MIRTVFAGTPGFSIPCLNALMQDPGFEVVGVVTQPDRKAGRGMHLMASSVKQYGLQNDLDIITPERLKDNAEALSWIREKRADVLVVVAFGMLLPKAWLDAARCGAINVHASLLPRWRGAAPIERALLAGDSETGISIMHMDEGLDTGGVYARFHVRIGRETTASELHDLLSGEGAKLLVRTLPDILNRRLKCEPQDSSMATYAAKLRSAERNIDWSRSAEMVARQLRTFSPGPGARSRLQGKWVKIIAGDVVDSRSSCGPGTLLVHDKCLDVACGHNSVLRIEMLQVEGKRPHRSEVFLQGLRFFSDLRFGT